MCVGRSGEGEGRRERELVPLQGVVIGDKGQLTLALNMLIRAVMAEGTMIMGGPSRLELLPEPCDLHCRSPRLANPQPHPPQQKKVYCLSEDWHAGGESADLVK